MFARFVYYFADAVEQFAESRIATQVGPDRNDWTSRFRWEGNVLQACSDHDIFLPRVPHQQCLKRRQEQNKGRHIFSRAKRLQPVARTLRELDGFVTCAK